MKLIRILAVSLLLVGCTPKQETLVIPENPSITYEIYVGAFSDSDGDGMGDLQGVIDKLDYIRELGATSIWLMPIHPSPTYHKYDVLDYMAVDPSYGTLEDFDALIEAMNARGMTLIMDLVLNHTSAQHPWFLEAKQAALAGECSSVKTCDYYHFSETFEPGFTSLSKNLFYESVFWDQMPDLNLQNETLRSELEAIMKFWIDRGVSGFRLDATTHFERENVEKNVDVLQWISNYVKSLDDQAYIVGEAWTSNSIVQKMYASGVDSFFNFGMSQQDGQIVKSINNAWGYDLAKNKAKHDETIQSFNPNAIDALFLSNHDNNRSAGYLSMDPMKQKLAASIYMMMPGNVFIYYGEEIGMLGSGKDENKRLSMPWNDNGENQANDPSGADYKQSQPTTVESSLKASDSLLNFYKKLGNIRNSYPSISRGKTIPIDTGNRSIYLMEHEELYIIHNLSKESQTLDTSISFNDIVLINGKIESKGSTLELDAYSSAILLK